MPGLSAGLVVLLCGTAGCGGGTPAQGPTGPWQLDGQEVSSVASYQGADECDQQGVHYLHLPWPLTGPGAGTTGRQFARDPGRHFSAAFAPGFARDVELPADAVDTGLRNDGIALWTSAAGDRVFLVGSGPGAGEQWPATPYAVGCD